MPTTSFLQDLEQLEHLLVKSVWKNNKTNNTAYDRAKKRFIKNYQLLPGALLDAKFIIKRLGGGEAFPLELSAINTAITNTKE